jgi:WD40 repeat protein
MKRSAIYISVGCIFLAAAGARSLRAESIEHLSTVRTSSAAKCVRFFPDGDKVAICFADEIVVCESMSGRQRIAWKASASLLSLCVSGDGDRIAAGGGSIQGRGEISLWDAKSGKLISIIHLPKNRDVSTIASVSKERYFVLVRAADTTFGVNVLLVDMSTQKIVGELATGELASSMALSPDRKKVITGNLRGEISIYDIGTISRAGKFPAGDQVVYDLLVAKDGKTLVAHDSSKELTLWDLGNYSRRGVLNGHREFISALAISSDGKKVAAGARDGQLIVWEIGMQRQVISTRAHDGDFMSIDFSDDGKLLATSGLDKTTKIWRVK